MASAAIPDAEVPRSTVLRSVVGNKGAQRTVDGAADHDATEFAGLRSRRFVATRRLVAERGADIKRIVRPDKDRAWLAELMPGGDEIAVQIENLDATVAAVGNIDTPERAADENIVRPLSGPGPVLNTSRWRQIFGTDGPLTPGTPPMFVSNPNKLVGDYTNPILKTQAAEAVKRHGEIELGGWRCSGTEQPVLAPLEPASSHTGDAVLVR